MQSSAPPPMFPEVNSLERERLFAHVDRIVTKWSDSLERVERDPCEDDEEPGR